MPLVLLLTIVTLQSLSTPDVGVTAVISPTGSVDSGTIVIPQAIVRNFSSADTALFPVTMNIGSRYSHTMTDTLGPGLSDTITFPAWVAQPLGSLPVVCFTALAGDTNRTNDTLRTMVTVIPRASHDIGASVILSPPTMLYAGDTVVPKAIIRNYGTAVERYFDVRFKIGLVYDRIVTVNSDLIPDGTVDVVFPAWIAREGYYSASCSTMLVRDTNRLNDKTVIDIAVLSRPLLRIEWDQTETLQIAETGDIRLFAELDARQSDIIELRPPIPPIGWGVTLLDSIGEQLRDTDGDSLPDLGSLQPGHRTYFVVRVRAPAGIIGTPGSAGDTIVIRGFCHRDSTVRDSALLVLQLAPELTIHNFPNPFSERTTFWFGIPEPGRVRLTIYNRAGERVCRIIDSESYAVGLWSRSWDGVNEHGRAVAPGIYDYLFEHEAENRTSRILKKLVITRE